MKTGTLKVGTVLWHGSRGETKPFIPRGPGWFSESRDVVEMFVSHPEMTETRTPSAGDTGLVMSYRVTSSPTIIVAKDWSALERILKRHSLDESLTEDMRKMSRWVCERIGLDGWIVRDPDYLQYKPNQNDIMLCDPAKFVELQEAWNWTTTSVEKRT